MTCYKQILPRTLNTAKHTVKETTKSNTTQLHKRNTIRKGIFQYNHIQKQKTICKDTVQYDHIRHKTSNDSNLLILSLICKNIQTCTAFQNNIAISPNKKLIHNKNKFHNNITVSESSPSITPPQYDINQNEITT